MLEMKKKYVHDGVPEGEWVNRSRVQPTLRLIPPSVVLYRELRNDGAGSPKPKSFKHTAFEHQLRIAVHSICLNKSSSEGFLASNWPRDFPFRKPYLSESSSFGQNIAL